MATADGDGRRLVAVRAVVSGTAVVRAEAGGRSKVSWRRCGRQSRGGWFLDN